ncbi:MAG: FAD-dependent oxidoreductase [Allorhizobium sp.]
MADSFRYIIIGRGMLGSAAARHLAARTDGVALIGPDEPEDPARHAGVFASHYDEARITRTIDTDPVWARLARRSIERYGEIASASGIDFFHEAGCLMVGPARGGDDPYVADICAAAEKVGARTELLDDRTLAQRFAYFSFGRGCEGVFEAAGAGYVNPRRLVEAQSLLAKRAGATLIAETVIATRETATGVEVTTAEGRVFKADKVLVAAGGFSIAENLLPRPLDLSVYARTVAFFEIPEAELSRYAGMPSLIHQPANPGDHIYLLPPVLYPDGKTYLKIGGDPDDLRLATEPEVRAWFRSGGRESTRDHLKRIIDGLIPSLADAPLSMGACVTSFTPTGYPAIGSAGANIAVLTGGCGAAAKSSDEIGRLGALALLGEGLEEDVYGAVFRPVFR